MNHSITIDPYFKEAYYNKGFICYNLKQYDEAIESFNKVIEIDPEFYAAFNCIVIIKSNFLCFS